MTPDEIEIMKLTVKTGVQEGLAPVWEKLNNHDTAIALTQQELRNGITSQVAQGKRLGNVEHITQTLQTKIKVHMAWIIGIGGILTPVAYMVIKWWMEKH